MKCEYVMNKVQRWSEATDVHTILDQGTTVPVQFTEYSKRYSFK